ncbi:hypothetical protein PBY51_016962 [Eleginops maclovinus]|uniref:Uncharacterized protein n=1 Tax=Eleginops maclovinus TaxID=56733 RepID=A0AAN7WRI1_ELEMC|nr:hypothetical protein PBY51_016962 [Eleginops maclovinus]
MRVFPMEGPSRLRVSHPQRLKGGLEGTRAAAAALDEASDPAERDPTQQGSTETRVLIIQAGGHGVKPACPGADEPFH